MTRYLFVLSDIHLGCKIYFMEVIPNSIIDFEKVALKLYYGTVVIISNSMKSNSTLKIENSKIKNL